MRIFLVAGKAGSGKGEVAKMIKEYYIYKLEECAITSYSKYIKNFAVELTDWDGVSPDKPREFLQKIGDKIREIDPNYFPNHMIQDIEVYKDFVQNIVVSDVRMPNEIDNLKESFDEVYSIYVENQFSKSNLTLEEQMHITETALEGYTNFDLTVANDDLTILKDKIFKFLEGLK